MIMLVGRDYVSELRPPTGLLFIPRVMCEHGQQLWDNIDKRKLLIRPPELSGNPTSHHPVASREEVVKKMMNLGCTILLKSIHNHEYHLSETWKGERE
jgi:hypothetical protein